MRKRISEVNKFPSFDVRNEYQKIHFLFTTKPEFGFINYYGEYTPINLTYNVLLEDNFLNWHLRGSFISLYEMLDSLEISFYFFQQAPSEERFLDYIQFIKNAVNFVDAFVLENHHDFYRENSIIRNAILDNINLLSSKFNVEFIEDGNEEFLIDKNELSTVVSKQFPDLSKSVAEYLKIDNRDDIVRKAEILCTFAKSLEPHVSNLKKSDFRSLISDTTMLLNNFGVRHCIDPNSNIGNIYNSMSDKEKIMWYDRTFEMFIACMSVLPYLGYKDKIKKIRQGTN